MFKHEFILLNRKYFIQSPDNEIRFKIKELTEVVF